MDRIQTELGCRSDAVPIDLRIVTSLSYGYAAWLAWGASLLTLAAGRTPDSEPLRVLFGTLVLVSYVSRAAYIWILAGLFGLCAWGLRRQRLFGWWLSVMFLSYLALDGVSGMMRFSSRMNYILISLSINAALLIWLYCRRRLFGIGPLNREVQGKS